MTDKTNTPAQPMLTDEEIIALEIEVGGTFTLGPVPFARTIESALLSKLRAPVAGEPEVWKTGDDDLDMALNMAGMPGDAALAQVEAVERLKARLASAPVADERDRHTTISAVFSRCSLIPGATFWNAAEFMYDEMHRRAALASAPVAGEADEDLAPLECPITRRPLFMAIEHPELGMVPTYGGPFDSYTIPHMDGEAHQPWHERELFVRHYDHDLGGWRDDESIPLRVVHEDVLHELQDAASQASTVIGQARDAALWREYARVFPTIAEAFAEVHGTAASQASATIKQSLNVAPQASEAVLVYNGALTAAAKVCADIARQYDPQNNQENALASELYSAAAAILKLAKEDSAALSAQPGAQKNGAIDGSR